MNYSLVAKFYVVPFASALKIYKLQDVVMTRHHSYKSTLITRRPGILVSHIIRCCMLLRTGILTEHIRKISPLLFVG